MTNNDQAVDKDERVEDGAVKLPDSWETAAADKPRSLSQFVSPSDLEGAVEHCDTLLEVTQRVNGNRKGVREALSRLGLEDQVLTGIDALTIRQSQGVA